MPGVSVGVVLPRVPCERRRAKHPWRLPQPDQLHLCLLLKAFDAKSGAAPSRWEQLNSVVILRVWVSTRMNAVPSQTHSAYSFDP